GVMLLLLVTAYGAGWLQMKLRLDETKQQLGVELQTAELEAQEAERARDQSAQRALLALGLRELARSRAAIDAQNFGILRARLRAASDYLAQAQAGADVAERIGRIQLGPAQEIAEIDAEVREIERVLAGQLGLRE
ncbi:MAG: hypothetical protein KC492_25300, partial [Myxococcales bacterium]|nr:hypothetical protein [Myxococcales bacterium]